MKDIAGEALSGLADRVSALEAQMAIASCNVISACTYSTTLALLRCAEVHHLIKVHGDRPKAESASACYGLLQTVAYNKNLLRDVASLCSTEDAVVAATIGIGAAARTMDHPYVKLMLLTEGVDDSAIVDGIDDNIHTMEFVEAVNLLVSVHKEMGVITHIRMHVPGVCHVEEPTTRRQIDFVRKAYADNDKEGKMLGTYRDELDAMDSPFEGAHVLVGSPSYWQEAIRRQRW